MICAENKQMRKVKSYVLYLSIEVQFRYLLKLHALRIQH